MRRGGVIVVAALLACGATQASAQVVGDVSIDEAGATETGQGRSNAIIGLGVGLGPDYEGSEDYEIGIVPFGRFSYQEYSQYLSFGPDPGSRTYQMRLNVLPYEGFEMGPMLDFRRGRKSVENNRVDDMSNIDNAWEVGGFTRYWIPLSKDESRPALSLELSGAADVSGAYDGWWIQPGIGYRVNVAPAVALTTRVFADYANSDYMDEYFGVSASNSTRSGLRQYDADAGFKDAGATLGVTWFFAKQWFAGAAGAYKRMVGDAGSSPVTRNEGNKNQGSGAVFVGYRF
jgi:Outer membrane protein V